MKTRAFAATFFALVTVLLLAGCGGTSGSSTPSTGVTVTPAGAQVAAGATQQMRATASDGGQAFIWQVNGTAGGSGNLGTISASGLYTAPKLPPADGNVTITAIEQGGAGASGSATLTVQFSNASLSGSYVFSFGGRNLTTPFYAIGEFITNGAGQFQSGLEDSNNGTAVPAKTSIPGSYAINPDGSGTLTLGNLAFRLAMQADGGAVLLSSTNGTTLLGHLSVQGPSANNLSNFTGPLILRADGQAGNQGYAQLALASTVQSGTISGYEDVSGFSPATRRTWTGAYRFDGNNHGTLTIQDATGSHAYSFYAISTIEFALLSSDPNIPAAGNIRTQTGGPYSNASLNGAYVFLIRGNSSTQAFAQAGQFNPNGLGQLGMVTEDSNLPGNFNASFTTTGTYSFDTNVNGRGTLTLNNQGIGAPQNYVFYMLSPGQAEFITSNSNFVGGGAISMQQNSPSSVSALNGAYSFLLRASAGSSNPSAELGTLGLNGSGTLSGNMVQNSGGTVSNTINLSGTYALGNSVRGTATLISNGGTSAPFALYPISSNQFFLISTDPASAYAGRATFAN